MARWHELLPAQREWAADAPLEIRHFAKSFHGPWILEVALAARVPRTIAEKLVHDLKFGFPLVGDLPESYFSLSDGVPNILGDLSLQDLDDCREETNDLILHSLREDEYAHDVWRQTVDDAADGYMTEPEVFCPKNG